MNSTAHALPTQVPSESRHSEGGGGRGPAEGDAAQERSGARGAEGRGAWGSNFGPFTTDGRRHVCVTSTGSSDLARDDELIEALPGRS